VAGFLRKLIRGEPSAAVAEAVVELERLAAERPALATPAAVLADVLPARFGQPIWEAPRPLSDAEAAAKLAGGVPLLRGEAIALDARALRRRWLAVCTALQRHQGSDSAKALAHASRGRRLDLLSLAADALAGRPEQVHEQADRLGLDPSLAATVLRLSLFPVLAHWSSTLAPLRHGSAWEQGHCPTCGSWPLLGEFRGLEQTRLLRCGLCASEWPASRLRCPFCASADHQALGYFHVEGQEDRYRAAACEACRGYVKMLSTLQPLTPPQLLIADLATVHLDLAAAERGYVAPA